MSVFNCVYCNVVQPPLKVSDSMPVKEPTYTITPFDGTPGQTFDDFNDAMLNALAEVVDDRGWSLADHVLGQDEGSPAHPHPAAGSTDGRKSRQLERKRQKSAYGFISRHQTDPNIISELRNQHYQNMYQNARSAYTYLLTYRRTVDRLRLKQGMDKEGV